ncbi:MAG: IS110 family transposase [Verrucomicrobia bacterium]|nr:IS110 family transposase [Verrucomicrobiota bacterium]
MIEYYEKNCREIKKLTKRIEELARNDEDVKRLLTGIGAITAIAFKVEIEDSRRFKNSRSVEAYLGMAPKQYSSGEIKRQVQISKCGSQEMRSVLMEAGIVMTTR